MAFLSPGDLCGIETKFMCIFSPLSRSLSLSACSLLFLGFSFHFSAVTRHHSTPEYICLPLPRTFPFAYSLVSIIISCFVAFSFCFCFAFDFNFSFFLFFSHFFLATSAQSFGLVFSDFVRSDATRFFSTNAALGNCVWNREWNGNGNGSGNPSSTPRGVHKICHVHLLLCLRLIWSEKCQKATENWVNKL